MNADQITGFTIVVDVFRAFSVAYYIYANRPEKYILVDSIDEAFALKALIPNAILIGERQGVKIDGFDFGNSPTEIIDQDFTGRTVIHTTTAGTKGVLAQKSENEVVVGSFVNAEALVDSIHAKRLKTVNIYCTAPQGIPFEEEDYLCADYLKAVLLGEAIDFLQVVEKLKVGIERRFSENGFGPYSDFEYCMQLNRFNTILKRKIASHDPVCVELDV